MDAKPSTTQKSVNAADLYTAAEHNNKKPN